jgi:hypothetical protein
LRNQIGRGSGDVDQEMNSRDRASKAHGRALDGLAEDAFPSREIVIGGKDLKPHVGAIEA